MAVEYKLLKELPFMASGTVFTVYCVVDGKKEFYSERGDGTSRIFNPYEDGILRSILEQTDWVERRGN